MNKKIFKSIPFLVLCLIAWFCYGFRNSVPALEPDAQNYKLIAESMTHLYDTQFREPVWIWLVKLSLYLGQGENSLRILGVFLFLLTCFALYRLAYKIFGSRWWGILAALIYGLNPYLEQLALRGLRDNAFNLSIVLMSLFLYTGKIPKHKKTYLFGLTLVTCFLVGVRINTFLPLLLLIPISFWRMKIPLAWAAIPLGTSLLLIAPYLFYCHQKYDDALYSSNMHAKWWRNHEFVTEKKVGCVGCPTEEELKTQSGYAGSPVTTFEYVFKMRTLDNLIRDTVEGYSFLLIPPVKWLFSLFGKKANGGAFTRILEVPGFPIVWFYGLGLLGLFICSFKSVFLLPLLAINLMPFTYSLGMDERIFTVLSPYMALVSVYGFLLVLRMLSKLRASAFFNRKQITLVKG